MTTDERAKGLTRRVIDALRQHPGFNAWWCEQTDACHADMEASVNDEIGDELACGTMDGSPECIAALTESVERAMMGLDAEIDALKRDRP